MPSTPTSSQGNGLGSGTQDITNMHSWKIARQPGSTITFASFDPGTATGDHHIHAFRKLSLNEELCRPKRVVIEILPDGKCTWRFVPKARLEEGVENEGTWPRIVDVCGQRIMLNQDEWDMYKLDLRYECLVKKLPALSVVQTASRQPSVAPPETLPESSTDGRVKRRMSNNSPSVSRRPSGGSSGGPKRKARRVVDVFSSSEEDEDEVDQMIIDDSTSFRAKAYQQSERLKKVRENKEEARQRRQEQMRKWREKNGLLGVPDDDEDLMSWSESHPTPKKSPVRAQTAELPTYKRKAAVETDNSDEDSFDEDRTPGPRFMTYVPSGKQKRTRTTSPGAALRELKQKRATRGRKRQEEKELRARQRAEARQAALMAEIMAEHSRQQAQQGQSTDNHSVPSSSSSTPHSTDHAMGDPDEAARLAMLEESRRKIAELEKDKPLWEEQARKRAEQEDAERRRAEEEKARRANNDAAAKEREKQRAKEAAEEKARQERDAAVEKIRRKRRLARDKARADAQNWTARGWNAAVALERYKHLSQVFDKANFFRGADGDVIVFESIPWPVLHRPLHFGVEDVDWSAVEAFFKQVKRYLSTNEYRALVEKSHKRFHPDRWRSRRVLQSVEDEEEKECLEVAANTVAQALTPLWEELKGR